IAAAGDRRDGPQVESSASGFQSGAEQAAAREIQLLGDSSGHNGTKGGVLAGSGDVGAVRFVRTTTLRTAVGKMSLPAGHAPLPLSLVHPTGHSLTILTRSG